MEFKDYFNYGVPTAILIMLLYGVWKTVAWARVAVAEPVVAAHIELIKTLQEHLPKQSELATALLTTQHVMADNQSKMADLVKLGSCQAPLVADALKRTAAEVATILRHEAVLAANVVKNTATETADDLSHKRDGAAPIQ